MIVFDVSSLVGAVLKQDSIPAQGLFKARATNRLARSAPVEAELRSVLNRPKFARSVSAHDRPAFTDAVLTAADMVVPNLRIAECRDPADDMYLELALAAGAGWIVSSEADLVTLDPWRGIRIVRPAEHLHQI